MLYFLPLIQFQSISYILEHFLTRAPPTEILELTQLFGRESMSEDDEQILRNGHLKKKRQGWIPYLPSFFLGLAEAVNRHDKYYSFDENCYFLYILLKNEQYWDGKIDYQYLGEIQKLKYSVKTASHTRGFKLQIDSYFYKLLNYVDLVAFFDGG